MHTFISTDQFAAYDNLSPKARHVLALRESVFAEWEVSVRAQVRNAGDVAPPVLIDTLPLFYGNLVEALSPGFSRENAASDSTAAAGHGGERARTTAYRAVEVVHEYQLLRDALVSVCGVAGIVFDASENEIIMRSFDQAIREAIDQFTSIQTVFRERIANTLTHDMRTPLSVIATAAELLIIGSDERVSRLATTIAKNCLRLDEMFREQLNALNVPPTILERLTFTHWNALELAQVVCDQSNLMMPGSCQATGQAAFGWWDREAVRRAMENLVNNGLKYGDGKGPVTIDVQHLHGRVIISVHNSGNPIDDVKRGVIFQYLNRAHDGTEIGWGIGLPFVQNVAKRHSGTIVVDSSVDAGTTFAIDMPCDARQLRNQ